MAPSLIVEVAPARPATDKVPAAGPVYRNVLAKDGFPMPEGVNSLYELFAQSVAKYPTNACLGTRQTTTGTVGPFTWLTYKETSEIVKDIASALGYLGLEPHSRCGIFGANCPEWMMAMQACNRMTIYSVPLYDSLGENAIEFVVTHSEASIVFVASEKYKALLQALPKLAQQVKTVVYWGGTLDAESLQATKALGIRVHSWQEAIDMGQAHPAEPRPPKIEDLCTIMYTSGTTGDPKGVLLTHRAVLAEILGLINFLKQVNIVINQTDSMLSYLPLAHIFDRVGEELFLYLGARLGYWRGDIKGLVDDIAAMRPTIFFGVPRVFDRIYSGVNAKVKEGGGVKAFLFKWGFQRKLHALNRGHKHDKAAPFFDWLVFGKIKARLGGNVRLILSGGAPLASHTEDFLKVTMCAPVVQGYGLTETCAGSFISVPNNPASVGTVGPPLPLLEFRLEAVPEMNYDPAADPPRGELCLRGPSVFSGYYKQQDKTDEVLEPDGWFHTGDVAQLNPDGFLKIIDRKKNIFKLSQGEYIAVEKVEAVYKKNDLVEQVWVYGNSFESTLVGVVVPVEEKLMSWARANGVQGSFADACQNDKVKKYVLDDLTVTAKAGKLKGFEMVKAVHLDPVPFSVENELLTPTFKLKRPPLQKKYQAAIDAMYKVINKGS